MKVGSAVLLGIVDSLVQVHAIKLFLIEIFEQRTTMRRNLMVTNKRYAD